MQAQGESEMIDITGLRQDKRPQSSTIVHALLDRLEAAESDAAHQKGLAESAVRVAEGWERKCGELRALVATLRSERWDPAMQDTLMKFDPATGEERPYPSHATQWRNLHGTAAWLFDPWTGKRRNAYDVGSDVHGLLIAPAGTLGRDMGGGCATRSPAQKEN